MLKIYLASKKVSHYFINCISSFLFISSFSTFVFGQATNPTPFDLSVSNFSFTTQTLSSTTYPASMQGWKTGTNNLVVPSGDNTASPLADEPLIANGSATTSGLSNLGANGFNFLSTGTAPNQQVGSLALSLNTTNRNSVFVTWTAADQTNSASSREMNLTLQYRIGTTGVFTTISGGTYTTNNFNQKASATFVNVFLPNTCENKPVVQLRWIYFESAAQANGIDAIRLDDITVTSSPAACTPPTVQSTLNGYLSSLNNTIEPVVINGNGVGHIIVFKLGNAGITGVPVDGTDYSIGVSSDFSQSNSTIATGEKVVYVGTGSVLVTGLAPNSFYSVKVFEYSNTFCYSSGNGQIQQTFGCSTPTTGVSNISVGVVTGNTATLNWTNGNGTNRLVILNAVTLPTGTPANGTTYLANSDYSLAPAFAAGTGKVVYNGTGNSVNITGLSNNITYYARVFEYKAITNCYTTAVATNFSTVGTTFTAFDNFDRANNTTAGIPSSMGVTPPAWTEYENAATNASIVSNALQLNSCPTGTCTAGREVISYDMSAQYATAFALANATLQWHFNMKQSRSTADLSGFGATGYGIALVIGANETDIRSATADGYAVIMGETGTTDPIRLVHFTNGINNYTSIVDVPSPTTKTNYMSVRVTYNPCTNQWGLLVRDDGAVAFQDPLTITGVEVNVVNTTYTNTALNYLGALWNHATANSELVLFDNISIPNALATTNTYTWNGATTDYQVATNWTPSRTCPKVNDILVFDGSSPTTSTVINVPTQTIGKLLISGNIDVIFKDVSGDAAISFLTIGGGIGTDFSVASGSTFRFDVAAANNANDALIITLNTGATAVIDGTVVFQNTNAGTAGRLHQLFGTDLSSIIVNFGGIVRAEDLAGDPFGATGTQNVVQFLSGSIYESVDGSNPFGLTQPASRVVFQTGSTYRHLQTSPPSFSGRVYADFEYAFAGTSSVTAGSNTASMTVDNLKILSGVFNITGTFNSSQVNINVKRDLIVSAGASFNYSPGAAAYASTVAFTSTNAIQKINSAGTITFGRFAIVELNNTNTTPRLDVETNIRIQGTLKITGGNLNLSTGDIAMQSDATSTANVAAVNGTVTYGSGRFSIERYLFAKKSWRYLATPVDIVSSPSITDSWREGEVVGTNTVANFGTRITGPVGMDEFTQRPSMKSYNPITNNYDGVNLGALSGAIANKAGYAVFVIGDRTKGVSDAAGVTTLRIKGKIRTGDQIFSVNANSFQSVGNPFASQIEVKKITKNSITDAIVIWDPNAPGNYNVGAWKTYSWNAGTNNYERTPFDGTTRNFIESGEAFFVQNNVGTTQNLVIKEADKTNGSNMVSRTGTQSRGGIAEPTLEINLYAKNADGSTLLADGVKLNFDNTYSDGLDNMDVRKVSNTYDNLGIKNSNNNFVIERRKNLLQTDSIFLNLTSTRIASYRFEIDPSVLNNTGLDAFLVDKFLQTKTPISLTAITNINFDITVDAGSRVADRFMIVFKQSASLQFTTISATRNTEKTITVKWGTHEEVGVINYEVEHSNDGINFITISTQLPLANNNTNPTYSKQDADATKNNNWYRVKANMINGITKYTAIAMVGALQDVNIESSIAVYPNPIENKLIQIHFANRVGEYNVSLLNAAGKRVYTKNIDVVSDNEIYTIEVNKSFASGNYSLVLLTKDGIKQILPIAIL